MSFTGWNIQQGGITKILLTMPKQISCSFHTWPESIRCWWRTGSLEASSATFGQNYLKNTYKVFMIVLTLVWWTSTLGQKFVRYLVTYWLNWRNIAIWQHNNIAIWQHSTIPGNPIFLLHVIILNCRSIYLSADVAGVMNFFNQSLSGTSIHLVFTLVKLLAHLATW